MEQGDTRIIGAWYIYIAKYPSYRHDQPVLLCGIRKGNASPDDPKRSDIRSDRALAEQGGIEPGDIAFIKGWLPREHRPSWIEEDCSADNLLRMPKSQWPINVTDPLTYYAIDGEGNVLATVDALDERNAEALVTANLMDDTAQYAEWSANHFMLVTKPPCNCGI